MIDKLDDSTEDAMNEGRGLCRCLAVGVALAVAVAAALLLFSGCSTIDTAAIDEAWNVWTNAIAQAEIDVPPEIDVPGELRDIGDGFQVWYGRVNTWASAGESAIEKDIAACRKAGVSGYMIEMAGWARKDAWSDAWLAQTEKAYKHLLGECRASGLWLFVSIVNDNMGSGKYGDPGIPLSKVMPQARRLSEIVREGGASNVVVQPVAETTTAAGREFEEHCMKTLAGFPLVYNGGSRPGRVPSGYKYRAWHPFKVSDAIPRDALAVSDTGSIIQQLGSGLDGAAHPAALEAWARNVRSHGCPVAGYYAFKFAGHDAAGIEAVGRAAERTAIETPTEPTTPGASNPDAVEFGALSWRHGGFNGGGARLDSPRISGLTCDGKNLRYKWDIGMDGWGLSNGDAGAVCAVFFERDGKWIGGKFDWVSTSRASRELKHVESYSNWPSSGIKLPWRGRVAFVVVSADGRRRSNVVTSEGAK